MDMNALVPCPFNDHHMVSRRKLQYHIVKCKETYDGDKVPCPYNASEYINHYELAQHLLHCSSRAEREVHMYYAMSRARAAVEDEPPFHHSGLPEPTERWGLD